MDNRQTAHEILDTPKELINIEEVFVKKSPRLTKVLPKFFFRYLKRIIHQDELNETMYNHREKSALDFLDVFLNEFGVIIKTINIKNLPEKGRYIIASNHPLGGLDGIALMKIVGKVRQDIIFPVNDILLNIPNLKKLFIPINKHGSNAENIKIFNDTFESDVILLYFPAGLVSRKTSGVISDVQWKNTIISKAKKFKRDIIPVHIDGRNSNFFYNLANLRKFFGIKANIEMLYLVNEMYKQKDKVITITFGKPVRYQTFDKRHSYNEWAELMKQHVYALGRGEEFQLV